MKKGTIVSMIEDVYAGNIENFFKTCVDIAEEFRRDGDTALADKVESILLEHCSIIPASTAKQGFKECEVIVESDAFDKSEEKSEEAATLKDPREALKHMLSVRRK